MDPFRLVMRRIESTGIRNYDGSINELLMVIPSNLETSNEISLAEVLIRTSQIRTELTKGSEVSSWNMMALDAIVEVVLPLVVAEEVRAALK